MQVRSDGSLVYVPWDLEYDDDTGQSSETTGWDLSIAQSWYTHGLNLLFTKKPVTRLLLYCEPNSSLIRVVPPSPRPFFSFARLAQFFGSAIPEWCYSAFGYLLDDKSLFVLKLYTNFETDIRILAPTEDFPL